ncbi:MAG: tetratricopeptide repeat protein [Verrucomicrobiae bacterium]|nr:tetratricopeptide repeat protein [Verrucomicrobiae bacterium]
MEDSSALQRPFVARFLPWVLGALFLALYLATLHPWIGVANAALAGQLGGWDPDLAYTEPVLWFLTRPLLLLPPSAFPAGLNVLAALFGALTIALLARSVALLPHDRMREQRIRGHGENPTLHIRLAWVPVVFAAGLLGLQRTFWENATLQTGEMLDLLLFAAAVAALVEYRLDLRERWLWIAAFTVGAGVSNNWAMIVYAPLFLIAVIWLRGWSFFDAGFLLRMTICSAAGLAFYLLMPLGTAIAGISDLGFLGTLKANFTLQKAFLLGIPRGRALLLAMVTVLPLGLIAIRWQGAKGSSLERFAGFTALILLQILWLGLAVFLAFDPPFSPRRLVYLEKPAGELALLTFSFCSALAAGYFAGWFLLVGGTDPDKEWDRPNTGLRFLGRAAAGTVLAAGIAVPAGLALVNFPGVRAQNSSGTRDLANALADALPTRPALVLADDVTASRLLAAALRQRPDAPQHIVVDTRRGPDARYRQWLARKHRDALPELNRFAEARENVAGILTDLVVRTAAMAPVVYLNPSFGFFFERVRSHSEGLVLSVTPAPEAYVIPAPDAATLARALALWNRQAPFWETVVRMREADAPDARDLGMFWSRAGNTLGVDLQRAGQLEEAGAVFAQAERLNPGNQLAWINGRVNASLKTGAPIATNLLVALSRSPLVQTLNTDGPVDEPMALLNYGRALLTSTDRLPRQAWEALHRSAALNPNSLEARIAGVEALIQGFQIEDARRELDALAAAHPPGTLSREDFAALTRLEIFHALARQDLATAEKLIEGVRGQFATDTSLLDLLTALYIRQGRLNDAIPLLEQWRTLRLDDPAATIRLSSILIGRSQYDQALRVLDQFLARKSDNAPARINRAICLLRMGRLDDSRREYQGLVEKLPDLPLLHYGLAEIAVRRKSTNEAVGHLENYMKHAATLQATNTTEYAEVAARVQELRGGR